MKEITVTELSPEQVTKALEVTQLSLLFLNFKEDGETCVLQSAHAGDHSFVLGRYHGEFFGWRLDGGSKQDRHDCYVRTMAHHMQRIGAGKFVHPDGREIVGVPL